MSAERFCALCFCVLLLPVFVAGQDRIQSAGDRSVSVPLRGNVAAQILQSVDRGPLSPSARIEDMRLEIGPSAEQQAALEQLLERQRDPGSPDYHRWLTPEEFGEQFGASENDLAQLRAWLESEGFHVGRTARARNWLSFGGTATQAGSAFQTEIHQYESGGETHFGNDTEPRMPAAFAGVVTAVRGLDDFRPHPGHNRIVTPQFTASNGAHSLSPNDLATIYDITALYAAGYSGTGQKLAVMGQTDIALTDIRAFRTQFGLAANDPQLVLAGSDPGVSASDEVEADLDLEWAGAVARSATILYVYSQNVFSSLVYAIDNDLAPVISMSYGGCESGSASAYLGIAQQANAEGITWVNASGDTGAAGCDYAATVAKNGPAVEYPADVPEVTAVGGTEFSESGSAGWSAQNTLYWASALGYLAEKAWNDTASGSGLEASGGGASSVFSKPWWQAGPGVPSDGARDVPDVSLSASASHDGYLIYSGGNLKAVGGTSASTPSFAGIATLINQYVVAKGLQATPGLGNINPTLYSMAQTTTGTFHDITTGNNVVPCAAASKGCMSGAFGFQAGAGYDLVTGLGSVDAFNLATKWNLSAGLGTTMTLSASPSGIAPGGTSQLTANVTPVTGTNPPTGSVTFRAGNVSLGSGALIANGSPGANPPATAKLTVSSSSLESGANTVTASYTPTGNFAAASATATVTVTAPAVATTTTLTAAPASLSASGSTVLTATVKAASGSAAPTGSVSFAVGSHALGTATLVGSGTSSAATLTVKGASLSVGSNTITASYMTASSGSTPGFAASSGTASVTVTQIVATNTSITATLVVITSSGGTQLTATVKAAAGSAAPAGLVTFALGSSTLGTATLTATGTASLAVKGSSLAAGSNGITATYAGSGSFAASTSAAVAVTVIPAPVATAPVATTTVAVASPASIAATASTQIAVTVRTASGSSAPAGTVTVTVGKRTLGTATLTASGTAAITIAGSSLATGANTVTIAYSGSSGFAASTGALTITVQPPTATTTTLTASTAKFPSTATTQLTATVKAATGSPAPTGTVTFSRGGSVLGATALTASGTASSTAALSVKGASLATGSDTITASYQATGNFANSSGSLTVTVTAATLPAILIFSAPC